jgi:hypothetical protein
MTKTVVKQIFAELNCYLPLSFVQAPQFFHK